VSGFWHGANWTFIIWGALNGFYLVFSILSQDLRNKVSEFVFLNRLPRLQTFFKISITFFLACLAWIFFRANTTLDAFLILQRIFDLSGPLYIGERQQFLSGVAGIIFLIFIEIRREYFNKSALPFQFDHWFKEQLAYGFLIILILLVGVFDGGQFIYFQF
jgi:D-alanyl-lipoteichoic acid acyltransferase DltB (MBOAT superfamily)